MNVPESHMNVQHFVVICHFTFCHTHFDYVIIQFLPSDCAKFRMCFPFTSGTFIFYLAHSCALKQVCQIILWICQISFCLCQFLNDFSNFFMTHCFYELSRSFIIIWVFLFCISRCQFVNECATLFCGQSLLLLAQSYIFGDHSYFLDSLCQFCFECAA